MKLYTKKLKKYLWSCLIICVEMSCNLEKKVNIVLPSYQEQLVVECYLIPGEPYQLFLSRSVAYFSDFSLPDVPNATVVITHNGKRDTLRYEPFFFLPARKIYNYRSTTKVVVDYENPFYLYIHDRESGKELFAEDIFLRPISIDSVGAILNGKPDSLSSIIAFFNDPQESTNYYRFVVSHGNIFNPENQRADILLDDRLFTGRATLGTSYRFALSDTAIVTLYHLSQPLFQYFRTVRDAADFVTNPLRQPVGIASNIKGGVGIFATLSYDRDTLILRKFYQNVP
ncbi:MAG: DUF4249 domain-containing protein [Cytophagales bacterium]|nr:DUF4249 domain-containing protein [Cytophagales bacterium]MDW8383773.1 DUF4249 domain-containing protein [Flammeovirgaceae bacterium]